MRRLAQFMATTFAILLLPAAGVVLSRNDAVMVPMFLVLVAALLLLGIRHREAVERDRRAALSASEARLNEAGIRLHLSEVKGPVMDKLAGTPFLTRLSGRIYLTHYQAIAELSPDSLA